MEVAALIDLKDSLNSKIWIGDSLKPAIRDKLIEIANQFYDGLDLDKKALIDITFTGSLANFNYNNASDIDLHLILDFAKIDNNTFLVGEYFKAMAREWNRAHNIQIKGHEIEIYTQGHDEPHHSTGVFSLLSNNWINKPRRKKAEPDVSLINKKIENYADMIDQTEGLYDDEEYEESYDMSKKIMKKLRKFRKSGLEEEGELSNENIVFKYLRNNKLIKSLVDIRNLSYDKLMSINGNAEKLFKIYLVRKEKPTTYSRLAELERYQRKVKRGHSRGKRRLIGYGGTKNYPPYTKKPSMKRAKSAPPGAGGS